MSFLAVATCIEELWGELDVQALLEAGLELRGSEGAVLVDVKPLEGLLERPARAEKVRGIRSQTQIIRMVESGRMRTPVEGWLHHKTACRC